MITLIAALEKLPSIPQIVKKQAIQLTDAVVRKHKKQRRKQHV